MGGLKRMGLAFAAAWFLAWSAWTLVIYQDHDVFVFAFVELALGIPLFLGLVWLLIARALGALRGGARRRKE